MKGRYLDGGASFVLGRSLDEYLILVRTHQTRLLMNQCWSSLSQQSAVTLVASYC